jgi:hypothetical protein
MIRLALVISRYAGRDGSTLQDIKRRKRKRHANPSFQPTRKDVSCFQPCRGRAVEFFVDPSSSAFQGTDIERQ